MYIYQKNKSEIMAHKEPAPRHLLAILAVLSLALIIPAAAQGTGKLAVQPGETVEIEPEPLILDLINLRNPDTFNPITEFRQYRDDDTRKQIIRVIGVPNDDYFKINTYTFHGKYGRYFPYSATDGLIEQNSIVFVQAQAPTPAETTAPTVEETPMETPTVTVTATPEPTRAPLSGLLAVIAAGICALFAMAGKQQK